MHFFFCCLKPREKKGELERIKTREKKVLLMHALEEDEEMKRECEEMV